MRSALATTGAVSQGALRASISSGLQRKIRGFCKTSGSGRAQSGRRHRKDGAKLVTRGDGASAEVDDIGGRSGRNYGMCGRAYSPRFCDGADARIRRWAASRRDRDRHGQERGHRAQGRCVSAAEEADSARVPRKYEARTPSTRPAVGRRHHRPGARARALRFAVGRAQRAAAGASSECSGCEALPSPLWGGWRRPGGGGEAFSAAKDGANLSPHPAPLADDPPQGGGSVGRPGVKANSPPVGRCRQDEGASRGWQRESPLCR